MSKEKHLFLIDGSGYIFRAYYALPPLTRKSDGLPVGAVSGFCNMLYSFLEKAKAGNTIDTPTHLAVIFDSARKILEMIFIKIIKVIDQMHPRI